MTKTKIAFVISSLSSGGAERVVSTLSNHLIQHYEVYIIIMANKPVFYSLDENVRVLFCKESLKPSKSMFDAIKLNYSLYKAIVALIKKHEIELCIGFMTPNNILATLASKRCKIPVIISERNNPYEEDKYISNLWKILRRFTYPKADKLVVQTERIRTFYKSFIKVNQLETIPNPINPNFKQQPNTKKENIVLNVASLSEQKGQDMLIRAFAMTKSNDWRLLIVGEGQKRVELQNLIDDLKINDNVLLVGRQTDVVSYYTKSKIFAFSSLYEGFPNALQEAMFFGLACISTDCPTGPAEMIENDCNGFLIDVHGESQMTEKLKVLMDNENLRHSFGSKAKKSIIPYEISNITVKWKKLIEDVMS